MAQPWPDWPYESRVSTSCCCSSGKAEGLDEGVHGLLGQKGGGDLTPAGLRPPPLFRTLSQRGASASLPPHRRLRSMFNRPRAVLPDSGRHDGLSSWKGSSGKLFIFTDAHVSSADCKKSHSNSGEEVCISGPPDSSDAASDRVARKRALRRACSHQEVPRSNEGSIEMRKGLLWERETASSAHVPTLSQSLSLTGIKREVPPQFSGGTCAPARPPARGRGRWSSSVFPESWSEQSGWRRDGQQADKAQRKRRTRGRQRDLHKSVAASEAPHGHHEAGLCQWLQSLGFGEDQRDPLTTNRRQSEFGGELQRLNCEERFAGQRGGTAETDAQPHERRDRRPHFLPPIPQSTSSSLLNVPLLLPENSPPPTRCVSPESPCTPLPVPLLSHFPLPPRKRRDFQTLF